MSTYFDQVDEELQAATARTTTTLRHTCVHRDAHTGTGPRSQWCSLC